MTKIQRMVRKLQKDNPELTVAEPGKHGHYRLYLAGEMIGILPGTLAKEGLALNTISQLRRKGVRL
jgi:hypothetical protein